MPHIHDSKEAHTDVDSKHDNEVERKKYIARKLEEIIDNAVSPEFLNSILAAVSHDFFDKTAHERFIELDVLMQNREFREFLLNQYNFGRALLIWCVDRNKSLLNSFKKHGKSGETVQFIEECIKDIDAKQAADTSGFFAMLSSFFGCCSKKPKLSQISTATAAVGSAVIETVSPTSSSVTEVAEEFSINVTSPSQTTHHKIA